MKILALILARGGSKRLPGKNILPLGGKPLIVWTIDVAKNIPEICDILVSTDDPKIAKVCKDAGAFVPWLRPAELATDTASSVDAALHALDWYEAVNGVVDGLLLLQPTSPFRTKETVIKGIQLFKNNAKHAVLGVSPIHTHPMCTLTMDGGYLVPFTNTNKRNIQSEDLASMYSVNGSFYLVTGETLRKDLSFIEKTTIPLIIYSHKEAIDIDTEWEYLIAKLLLSNT